MAELLTGQALAVALDDAGLAPPGATEYIGADGRSRHEWWLSSDRPHGGEFWQPWCCLCCVAHLIERFKITINYRSYNGKRFWSVGTDWTLGVDYVSLEEPWYQFSDIPAVISRVALACAARESEAQ